jgi:hypothetical protein
VAALKGEGYLRFAFHTQARKRPGLLPLVSLDDVFGARMLCGTIYPA